MLHSIFLFFHPLLSMYFTLRIFLLSKSSSTIFFQVYLIYSPSYFLICCFFVSETGSCYIVEAIFELIIPCRSLSSTEIISIHVLILQAGLCLFASQIQSLCFVVLYSYTIFFLVKFSFLHIFKI